MLKNRLLILLLSIVMVNTGFAADAALSLQKNIGIITQLDLAHRRIIINEKEYALADLISVSLSDNTPYGDGVLQNGDNIEYQVDTSGKSNREMQGTLPVVTKIRLLSPSIKSTR